MGGPPPPPPGRPGKPLKGLPQHTLPDAHGVPPLGAVQGGPWQVIIGVPPPPPGKPPGKPLIAAAHI
jgi:hypothetical protein